MLNIQENVDTKDYTTFKIGGWFRYFVIISSVEDLPSLYAIAQSDGRYKGIPIFILGGGSNIIFPDGTIEVLAVKMEIKGFKIVNETEEYVDIKIGAGENWDNIVAQTVKMGFSGLESLSAIPGTVGATPVQNVGAYGSEVKDTIIKVEIFDIKNNKIKYFSNSDCEFKYRNSIFKNKVKGQYVITAVIYRLSKFLIKVPDYSSVKKYFIDNDIESPKLKDIREAIISIRQKKLPNPEELPNVGSFFKNPIISEESFLFMCQRYSLSSKDVSYFKVGNNKVKISAGWLIENSGLKGKSFGKISVYSKNALVLINEDKATKENLLKTRNEIIKIVKQKFGIILEQEPEML